MDMHLRAAYPLYICRNQTKIDFDFRRTSAGAGALTMGQNSFKKGESGGSIPLSAAKETGHDRLAHESNR